VSPTPRDHLGSRCSKAELTDSSDNLVVSCSVTATGGDIELSNIAVPFGTEVLLTSLMYSAPP
jgi:hypothetical protein